VTSDLDHGSTRLTIIEDHLPRCTGASGWVRSTDLHLTKVLRFHCATDAWWGLSGTLSLRGYVPYPQPPGPLTGIRTQHSNLIRVAQAQLLRERHRLRDSNSRHTGSKPVALSSELKRHTIVSV
jgi:hypothetical protein